MDHPHGELSLRVVRGEHAKATGVRLARTPVEHFTHAELPGGPITVTIPETCSLVA